MAIQSTSCTASHFFGTQNKLIFLNPIIVYIICIILCICTIEVSSAPSNSNSEFIARALLSIPLEALPSSFPHDKSPPSSPSPTLSSSHPTYVPRSSSALRFFEHLPRLDLKGKSVDSQFSPWDMRYVQSLGVMAIPFLCMAVVSVLAAFLYLWKKCGLYPFHTRTLYVRRNSTVSTCRFGCGGSVAPPTGYTPRVHKSRSRLFMKLSRYMPRAVMVCSFIGLAIAVSIGLGHNPKLDKPVTSAFGAVVEFASELVQKEQQIVVHIHHLNLTHLIPPDVQSILDGSQSALDVLSSHRSAVRMGVHVRSSVTIVISSVLLFVSVTGLVAAAFKWKPAAVLTLTVGFLILPLMWTFIAIHFPAAVLVGDACPDTATAVAGDIPDIAVPYVNYFAYCDTNGGSSLGPFSFLPDIFSEVQAEIDSKLQEALVAGESTNVWKLQLLSNEASAIAAAVIDMVECGYVSSAYSTIEASLCKEVFPGSYMLTLTHMIAAVLLCVGIAATILALDRFPSQNQYASLDGLEEEQILLDEEHIHHIFEQHGNLFVDDLAYNNVAQELDEEYCCGEHHSSDEDFDQILPGQFMQR